MCDKHSQAFTDMLALANAVVAAHDSMFEQCLSNPIKNAWGQPINLTKFNDAYCMAKKIVWAESEKSRPNGVNTDMLAALEAMRKAMEIERCYCWSMFTCTRCIAIGYADRAIEKARKEMGE